MEKNHRDEINRIREDQIKMMAQLLLAKGGESKDNQDVMRGIEEMLSKPIPKPREEVKVSPKRRSKAQ